jgi:peptidoglycan/LPS O-acetylase OafA/YrhL
VRLPGTALDHLNWVRGVAAVAVLVGHVRGLFFVDFEDVPRRTAGLAAFYLFSGLRHEAVIVFFVLSGFFIGTSVLGVTDPRPFSWSRFLLNRFTRLYVVLLPALALTACWDLLGMALFGTRHTVYAGEFPGPHMVMNDVRQTIGLPTLMGNLVFVQDFFVRPYGSNGPMWSLSYEFWFYLVFPLLAGAGAAGAGRWRRLAMVLAGLAVVAVGGGTFLLYFLIWCMGVVVARYWPLWASRGPRSGALVALSFGTFLGALVVARVRLLGPIWRGDLAMGMATSLLTAALLVSARSHGEPAGTGAGLTLRARLRDRYAKLGEALANCSYTLYLVHYPPLVFLYAWLFRSARWAPSSGHIVVASVITAGVLMLYAYPVSRLTEAHTDQVREFLGRRLGLRPGAARRGLPLTCSEGAAAGAGVTAATLGGAG